MFLFTLAVLVIQREELRFAGWTGNGERSIFRVLSIADMSRSTPVPSVTNHGPISGPGCYDAGHRSVAHKVLASLSSTLIEHAVTAPATPACVGVSDVAQLTEREREILALLARGASNREISETLYIAGGTVKNHLSNILGKLGVRDRTQAALKARELGLL
ncbi:MAG TPA: response regulator transcription factor [Ktedonobacteraceae bacterium]|nr:response regulator transcription factor [Ktedonobacteraceae bacterium]